MNIHRTARRWCAGLVAAFRGFWASAAEPREILNVSFDISRELYEEVNRSFVAHDGVVARKGTERLARAYLEYLFSEPAQEIVARHFYRPSDAGARQRHAASFGEMELFRVEDVLGPWSEVNAIHFQSGGIFDSIYERHRRP